MQLLQLELDQMDAFFCSCPKNQTVKVEICEKEHIVKVYKPYTIYYSEFDYIGIRRSQYIKKLFSSIREHQIHIQHIRLVLKRLYALKEINEIEYQSKDKIFIEKHKKLQKLIKKEKISIEYCEKQTEELKKIAKQLGLEIDKVKICKKINGVKRCGLKRKIKNGKSYYIERISPFAYVIYKRRAGTIENVKHKGKFTKFTKYGSCWEKKTVRMNDGAKDLIFENSVEEFFKENPTLKEQITKGKNYLGKNVLK